MNVGKILPIACTLFLLSGCSGCKIQKTKGDGVEVVNIVLCDLTRSLDSTSIDSTANHAASLLMHSANHTDWYFFGIGSTDYNEPLCQYSNKGARRSSELSDSLQFAALTLEAGRLHDRIKALYKSNDYQQTCITYALKTAYDKIKERKDANDSLWFNLIILSDLVEDCSHPALGEIHFINKISFDKSCLCLQKKDTLLFNLKSLGVSIYVVPESTNELVHVNRIDMDNAWRLIFRNYGYSINDQAISFAISQSLPEKFTKKRL